MNLAENAHSRENNFDFLRFFAASLVIFSHSFALFGSKFEPFQWLTGYITFGSFAVQIFFIMSGFLITKSWLDNPSAIAYAKKRILRILPALICAVLFAVFIVGLFNTELSFREYITNPETFRYIKNIFLFPIHRGLPGVFADNPYPIAVNGSLWTLSVEITMYFAVVLLGFSRLLKRRYSLLVILAALLFLDRVILVRSEYSSSIFLTMATVQLVKLGIFFTIGSLFYLYREKVSFNQSLLTVALIVYLATFRSTWGMLASYITLPYITLFIAYAKIPRISNFGKYGDFSYGMYVYAFPIQQSLMHFWKPQLSIWTFFACAFPVILLLAVISWKFVEKPVLRLKKISIAQFLVKRTKNILSLDKELESIKITEGNPDN
jgi:peptidoglycan/LPS O-acetylase OafA/YrhL